jgi:hypothetical protein
MCAPAVWRVRALGRVYDLGAVARHGGASPDRHAPRRRQSRDKAHVACRRLFFFACESQVASRRGVTPRAGRTARHAGRTPDALMVSWTRTTPRGQGAPPADELTRWALLPRRAHPQPPGSRAHTAHGAMPGSPRGPRG